MKQSITTHSPHGHAPTPAPTHAHIHVSPHTSVRDKKETEKADEKDEAQLLLPQSVDENVINTSHDKTSVKPKKASRRNKKHQVDTDLQIKEMTQAVNFQNEQVESYQLRPTGDATIVTMTSSDGISTSYIICANDDGSSYQVVPMIEM